MLNWANRFNICVFLDNHQYASTYNKAECLLATGIIKSFTANTNALQEFKNFLHNHNDWLFGHVAYDFKESIDASLTSGHIDNIGFETIFFFQPETVIKLSEQILIIESFEENATEIFEQIIATKISSSAVHYTPPTIQARINKQQYITTIHELQQKILRGDCYEINFCQEFYAENVDIDTLNLYHQLTSISPNPFSCYYKLNNKFLLCASPERYIQKTGTTLISQPIKGTYKRNLNNTVADNQLQEQLYNSEKDRIENVMVVDLVRNDLSKICNEGTVHVEELFGVYTFPQVHQMISTISGQVQNTISFADVLEATFPMGSMTGAPKRKVMQLIEQYEQTKRGLYSGAVGYITPENNFDFNVVIRSILYNATNKYLSYQVGGGITFNSNAEKEYEECLLKAEAINKVLNN
jgi:para-aminobenzoate synthetase component 1